MLGKRLWFFIAVLVALGLVLPAVSVRAQDDGHYFDEEPVSDAEERGVVLSDYDINLWNMGESFVVMITFTPSADEIAALLERGSHVDFVITFNGLGWAGSRKDHAVAPSDYVRHTGSWVEWDGSSPVLRVAGLNIEKRWRAGETITVVASIFGLAPMGNGRPGVSVELVSTKWWFSDGVCETLSYERETNDETLRYCGLEGARTTL